MFQRHYDPSKCLAQCSRIDRLFQETAVERGSAGRFLKYNLNISAFLLNF
jgi:hypothetical protein